MEQARNEVDCSAEYAKPATPAAHKMAMEVYDACYRNESKDINVPLMRIGEQYKSGKSLTTLNSDSDVVKLYMSARQSMGKIKTVSGGGSGFFVDEDGRFATDYHVIKNDPVVTVRTDDGNLRTARVIDKEAGQDTALLMVEKLHPHEKFKPLSLDSLGKPAKDEFMFSCGFANYDELHCSPGRFQDFIYQKQIKLDTPAPYLDPNRQLGKLTMHTEIGDSGGPIFAMKDGKVRMLVDMTEGYTKTIGTPAQRMMELLNRNIMHPRSR